jgi:hypothetical protein
MSEKELLERMENAGLITKGDYNTTIDLYITESFGNSIVITDKSTVEKKNNLTSIEVFALRYAAMNLHYQDDLLLSSDDDNAMQDSELRLEGFEGYPIDSVYGTTVYVDSLFIGTDNNIYCEVWVDANNYLLVRLF